MNDHYAIAHTAMRLAELRAEADRERLAASVRPARKRKGRNWTSAARPLFARATAGAPTNAPCCA